jgi:hypothetical protein
MKYSLLESRLSRMIKSSCEKRENSNLRKIMPYLLILCSIWACNATAQVPLYTSSNPPRTPTLNELPLMSSITKDGITWTFAAPVRVGQFINGDYYVVGNATVLDIQPQPTSANGRHGSMLNIRPNIQRSRFGPAHSFMLRS